MQFEQWKDLRVDRGRAAKIDLGTLYEGDSNGLLLGVRLDDANGPVAVTGTVTGWAILANGTTMPFDDAGAADNTAWVIVPQAALFPGRLQMFLRVTDGDEYAVALDAAATVKRTTTDAVVPAGDPLPNVDQLRNAAAWCLTCAQAAQEVAGDGIATVEETESYLGLT